MKPHLHDHVYRLLELVTAVIVICLMIVGIVAICRHVQSRTRLNLTRQVLLDLDEASLEYRARTDKLPAAGSWQETDSPAAHIADFVAAVDKLDPSLLQKVPAYMIRSQPDPRHPAAAAIRVVCDAWGTPINYDIRREGTKLTPLFTSAGPNRRFDDEETSHDNVISDEP